MSYVRTHESLRILGRLLRNKTKAYSRSAGQMGDICLYVVWCGGFFFSILLWPASSWPDCVFFLHPRQVVLVTSAATVLFPLEIARIPVRRCQFEASPVFLVEVASGPARGVGPDPLRSFVIRVSSSGLIFAHA